MDAMGFGMGCSCLQLTFQACNVTEARRLYDALVPVAPLMLALSAASPLWRGYIADVDCRWDVVSASVDDRTEEERGFKVLCCCSLLRSLLTRPAATQREQIQDSEIALR